MRPGAHNALVDVAGLRVGHATDAEAATGCTVVWAEGGAVGAVDVRGAAPGTRETDLLDPGATVERVDAVVLTGGSAFGLAAADGVAAALATQGVGLPVLGGFVVPIVPAAVLFDLGRGAVHRPPDAAAGRRALEAARADAVAEGNVGAGTGAIAGGVKGGVGTASAVLPDGWTVGALVAVNSLGRPFDPRTGRLYAEPFLLEEERAALPSTVGYRGESENYALPAELLRATTLAVVATDAALTKAQAQRLAVAGQVGLARALRPVHTALDGDAVFALATARRGPPDLAAWIRLQAVAADVVARAIARAVIAAAPAAGVPSYRAWLASRGAAVPY
jgi:L-aminopeptidase/D-esterase-like protein